MKFRQSARERARARKRERTRMAAEFVITTFETRDPLPSGPGRVSRREAVAFTHWSHALEILLRQLYGYVHVEMLDLPVKKRVIASQH